MSTSSNYPPGVSGFELEIAGPDWEGRVERVCPESEGGCGYGDWVDAWAYGHELHWTCPRCGAEYDEDERD